MVELGLEVPLGVQVKGSGRLTRVGVVVEGSQGL